ncbi:hypothetical protein GIB67_023072 [Kingdonia uniflora]|uniref:TFIIS N-terminal domain-containing protein n=1 Tax=Kingdonia uniflora TaxID=39325 RepID=A0A7J7P8F5_9MAGN|nr:hypothetical protein GIB67_023072 [Kingdonia uniflora]
MGLQYDSYRDEHGYPLMETTDLDTWLQAMSPTPVHDFDYGKETPDLNVEDDSNVGFLQDSSEGSKSGKGFKGGKSGELIDHGAEEMKELWDTVAGEESDVVPTVDGNTVAGRDSDIVATMDGNMVAETDSDVVRALVAGVKRGLEFAEDGPQTQDDEIEELFKMGKKKKKIEKTPADIALLVEHLMAELEVACEDDMKVNLESLPAINKLKKLHFLTEVLSKRHLQEAFLDHGVLTLLKSWLEPLPDGCLPNTTIRTGILKILTGYPIDLEQDDRRNQLKQSGLGKAIMFLSRWDEETRGNRKLAKELVDKWSRPLYNISTWFEDMRGIDEERGLYRRRPLVKRPAKKTMVLQSSENDLNLVEYSQERKPSKSSLRQLTTRPEAMALDFLVSPEFKIDPDQVRARAKQLLQDPRIQRRINICKKLQQRKTPKRKQFQTTKLSVEGRSLVF